ncbi:hypothetical protein FH609_010905 [Streptomyces sp. 3MP-14]|uniref:DUF3558 domain-containing protein n=1 Tax=Streptomyces mimosae TaxID=2586635 RepID=A0A5N5ZP93_9ACTN|nr:MULTISPECIES: hypothetical protein [Streptomyces]KAB8158321.1 hypothetical protein FH607_029530 [Streptomyces mimosae]KAB8176856.1 hypothetical protein FH609_010905 [Streptomyces sp. 3MP-14]
MRGWARVARSALPVALILGAVACTGDLGGDEDTGGTNPSGNTDTTVQQGRYSGLPEPCGAVRPETLAELLPDAEPEVYAGDPLATYDTGRRVGCDWRHADGSDTQRLTIDFLRVISYEPEVSDDDQAERDFETRAAEAGVTITGEESGDDGGDAADGGDEDGNADQDDPSATGGTTTDARELDGIGHVAFVEDRLTSDDAGDRRDVTLAFRNANVIVTVVYSVSTTRPDPAPDSSQAQAHAETVARQLAEGLDG